jgi:hypothetical protein
MEAAGLIAPSLVAFLVPKCGLCIAAWAGAFAGLRVEMCGSSPSWNILIAEIGRRLGLPAAAMAALAFLLLAVGTIVSWKLLTWLASSAP